MELFKNKYRTQTTRAQWWDYSKNGSYYITICTHNREWFFGTILNGKMVLSEIGEIITQEWRKSFEIRTELYCDSYVIMPNHIHAIIWLNKNGLFNHPPITKIGTPHVPIPNPDVNQITETRLPKNTGIAYRAPKSISSFVAGFKSSATKQINIIRNTPGERVWQSRIYDNIIRTTMQYYEIKNYIKLNPQRWKEDRFHLIDQSL